MTSPTYTSAAGPPSPMTPERWRVVDLILQAALACVPGQRDAVVAAACAGNEALGIEGSSLLAAHVSSADDLLELPAADSLCSPDVPLQAGRIAAEYGRGDKIERTTG